MAPARQTPFPCVFRTWGAYAYLRVVKAGVLLLLLACAGLQAVVQRLQVSLLLQHLLLQSPLCLSMLLQSLLYHSG